MSILIKGKPIRRHVLRGMLQGGAVSVALPFLNCFLNDNGTALASGAALPVRFGMWLWGIGWQPGFGISEKNPGIELLNETRPLEPFKKDMNYYRGFNAPLDGNVNQVHYSGLMAARTGSAPAYSTEVPAPTLDVLISEVVGADTRFRSLEMCACGGRSSYSGRSTASQNAAESTALSLYAKVFGPGFVDPNKAEFKPDPRLMVRQSVLSAVDDDAKRYAKQFGAVDKQRVDEYFTSIRESERQIALQLQQPPPNEACGMPKAPAELQPGAEMDTVLATNKAMAKILAMALACNQTNIFTMDFSRPISDLRKGGEAMSHHELTHEEPMDTKLGYQAMVAWFNIQSMVGLYDFVEAFASIREGDGTLLDHSLIFAHADLSDARTHGVDNLPMLTFGKAGGRVKTGLHIAGNGDPVTRVGLTAMQIMGLSVESWGTKSLRTSKPISAILA